MSHWRVLPLRVAASALLLAESAAAFDGLAADPVPTVRWYRSTDVAVVLGRGQRLETRTAALPTLTRGSGGGAVLMTPDLLSCDVLLPAGHPLLEGDLGAVFIRVGGAWARALQSLGVGRVAVHHGPVPVSRRGGERERLLASVCYATVGRGEITAGGRKIVGLSQRRRRQGALVQCGLLRRWEPARLLTFLGADPDDRAIHEAATGLDDLVRPAPSDQQILDAVSGELVG